MKQKKLRKIPAFRSEKAERRFWQGVDSTDYVDYAKAERWSFPNLKLTTRPITIRLPQTTIDRFKVRAHKMDIPYQTLMNSLLTEAMNTGDQEAVIRRIVREELGKKAG